MQSKALEPEVAEVHAPNKPSPPSEPWQPLARETAVTFAGCGLVLLASVLARCRPSPTRRRCREARGEKIFALRGFRAMALLPLPPADL